MSSDTRPFSVMSVHKRVTKLHGVTWVVRYRDPIPRERTFDRKVDAERFERFVRHQLDTDQYLDPESARITLREWSERWWPTIVNSERAPSTISGYESSLRLQVLPYLGGRRLRTLRRIDMEEWLGRLRTSGYSNSTIHSARTVAGMVLASAMDARIIASNPLTGLRLPKGSSRTRNALTAEQVEAIADAVDPWWRSLVLVLAYCGLRPGEARPPPEAPRRPGTARLSRRALSEHRGRLIEQDTKTHRPGSSRCRRPSCASCGSTWSATSIRPGRLGVHRPRPASGPDVELAHHVWDPSSGAPALPGMGDAVRAASHRGESAGPAGVPVSAAAAALGHDPAIFLRTYAHLYPGDLRAVADAMDLALPCPLETRATATFHCPSGTTSGRVRARGFRGTNGGVENSPVFDPLTREKSGGDGT